MEVNLQSCKEVVSVVLLNRKVGPSEVHIHHGQ